jgi:serine/threonine-protein kinase
MAGRSTSGLPLSVIRMAGKRLQAVALVVIALILVGWLLVNLIEGELAGEFSSPFQWGPEVIMLMASVAAILLARGPWLSPESVITVGLAYEVVVAACIPTSVYWDSLKYLEAEQLTSDIVGIGTAGIWMLFFTVLVPTRPRHALVALILAASATPVTVLVLIRVGEAPVMERMQFFFVFVFPYILVVVLAYIAALIIYGLGRDLGRAQEMGSYHLVHEIGHGGMGEVWRARHNMLARPAAIKLIRPDALGTEPGAVQEAMTRFEREAQATAALQSPHTVELYDFGVSEDGTLYHVMELLEGVDLETLVKQFGPLAPERVVFILRQACLSLGEAHRRGLVHRDIKPANLYLCQRAFEHDFLKVLDFGLVKRRLTLGADGDSALTRAQALAGTPAYLAPEQAVGEKSIDGRADLYSLGCVAYWLLTAQRVFEEESPIKMILAHVNDAPVAPSARAELAVPPELDTAILACLAKDPAERPASAEELAAALGGIGFSEPWTSARAAEWWQTHMPAE